MSFVSIDTILETVIHSARQDTLSAESRAVGRLVEAGVTNVDVFLSAPTEYDAAVDYLALWAEAFHKALP